MNRRSFIKTAAASGTFLPTFATLPAPPQKGGAADVRVALIGFGWWGKVLARVLAKTVGVRVRCVCDIWKFQCQQARAFFKSIGQEISTYENYREMLDRENANIDAVIIATPDWMHCEQACACLLQGKHVYCEAPIADTPEQAAKMCQTAKKSNRLLQIGFQRRSNPRYRLGFEHVIPEMLGGMKLIRAQWGQSPRPFLKVKRPPKAEILEKHGYPNAEQYFNWRWFRKFGEGPAATLMPHQVDLFSWAWNSRPTAVTAIGGADLFNPRREVFDTLSCLYEFKAPDGTSRLAKHEYTALSGVGGTFEDYVGPRALLHLGEYPTHGNCVRRSDAYHWTGESKNESGVHWETFVKKGWILPSEAEKHFEDGKTIFNCLPSEISSPHSWDCPLGIKAEFNPCAAHLKNFFAAVRGEEKLNCPPELAYAATVAVHGAIRSARQHATVYFKPEDFLIPS